MGNIKRIKHFGEKQKILIFYDIKKKVYKEEYKEEYKKKKKINK